MDLKDLNRCLPGGTGRLRRPDFRANFRLGR